MHGHLSQPPPPQLGFTCVQQSSQYAKGLDSTQWRVLVLQMPQPKHACTPLHELTDLTVCSCACCMMVACRQLVCQGCSAHGSTPCVADCAG